MNTSTPRHLDTFGTAVDGRLFFSEGGVVVASSAYSRAWQEARTLALPPAAERTDPGERHDRRA